MKIFYSFFSLILILGINSCGKQVINEQEDLLIEIEDSSMSIINSFIEDAIDLGVIQSKHKEYVPATIIVDGKINKIELRLKGDWTDHLKGEKVSYRIKVLEDKIFGLSTFSIQNPKTRNYTHEWFMHQLFLKEDLLSTKYLFKKVKINDAYKGIYAIEGHFDKHLLADYGRVEGPILKFEEKGLWDWRSRNRVEGDSIPFFESSVILPFKRKRTIRNEKLNEQFLLGALLVKMYQRSQGSPEEIFDMEEVGKYFALMEIANIKHSLIWHNQRFYYNPITAKLEFVAFDMEPFTGPIHQLNSQIVINSGAKSIGYSLEYKFYKNEKFIQSYLYNLKRFSSESYLDSVFSNLSLEIDSINYVFEKELATKRFSRSPYLLRCSHIRDNILKFEKELFDFQRVPYDSCQDIKFIPYSRINNSLVVKEASVNAYLIDDLDNSFDIQFENFHLDSICIVAVKYQDTAAILILEEAIFLDYYKNNIPFISLLKVAYKPQYVYFYAFNNPKEILKKEILPWPSPSYKHPRIELLEGFQKESPYYSIDGKNLTFKKGLHQINELIYIPEDYNVRVFEGTVFNFYDEGGLILNGKVSFLGTENQPIILKSDDESNGITILNSPEVNFSHVIFNGLDRLSYEGWKLESAVTIYGSDVSFEHVSLLPCISECAIHFIKCDYELKKCTIDLDHFKCE